MVGWVDGWKRALVTSGEYVHLLWIDTLEKVHLQKFRSFLQLIGVAFHSTLRVVYTMHHEVVPRPCKICD